MTAETGLKWLLRLIAVSTLAPLAAAVMPQAWLACLIDKGAPGTEAGILVTYLARAVSLLYAFVGLQCFIFSTDIPRYRPLIWIIAVGSLVVAPVVLIVLFSQVSPERWDAMFWIVVVDMAEGLAQAVLMVVLLLRVPPRPAGHAGKG